MLDILNTLFESDTAAMWVTAFAIIGLLAATIVLALLTLNLARASSQGQIVVSIGPSRWSHMHLEYAVSNIGSGPAFDVEISIDPPLFAFRDEAKQKELPFNNMSVVKPKSTLTSFMGEWSDYMDDDFTVTTSWAGRPKGRKRQSITYKMDLRHLHNVSTLGNGNGDPIVAIAQDIRKLREGIIPGLSGRNKLKFDVYDSDDRAAEQQRLEAMRAERSNQQESNDT